MSSKPKVGPGTIAKPRHTIEDGLARLAESVNLDEEQELGETAMLSMLYLKTIILKGNKTITGKINWVATTVALMIQDLDKMQEKVKTPGIRADGLEENVGMHTTQLTDHKRTLQVQDTKLEDLEKRSQRNTTHMLELPEGTEVTPIEQFL
ncbi:hypothetical protein NDU88_003331 [Pleurodeles waltl]|uniref:Uncharacterized protein n=1 Tax=Pleurodeles waltl TaxID=8319 RepID=A0AAV7KUI3_PLEWA|nr:hypothetical protein NDU88_003331 [Pleurodeles waltl]